MKEFKLIAPIKSPKDFQLFLPEVRCRHFYVYHHKFLNENFNYIDEFIKEAHAKNCKIYVNFKHNITEENLVEIKKFITYLKQTEIDGIFINSFAVLEAIKTHSLPFRVIIDSYFDIHNLAGIDFVNMFHNVDRIIVTEEIYMKNIAKIHKYKNIPLAIDSDNIPWCAEDIKKSNAIDAVVIKGKFASSKEILEGIKLVEKIIQKPKVFKNQKLPFKHIRKSIYQTNHFSGEMMSAQGANFKFSRNIQKFEWENRRPRLHKDFNYSSIQLPRLNLRLSSLDQLKDLKSFIAKIGFNPVYSIEYGEILNTADLSKSCFNSIIEKVKKFCASYNIKLQLSTPRILIERDFDRVYEYVKCLCLSEPHPASVIINNIGYFWAFINDDELQRIPIEIGQGINLLNSMSIKCINNLHPIETVDFSTFENITNIKNCIKKIKNLIPVKKLTIAGNVRIPTLGLCPLNNDTAIVSRLSCKAPCHKGHYALKDPSLKKVMPFVVDGFCRMHMFQDYILHLYQYIPKLEKIGINEFVIDLSDLPPKYVSIILTHLLNNIAGFEKSRECDIDEYFISRL